MSVRATTAAWSIVASLDERLGAVDAKRRPRADAARLVLLRMADRYQDKRGYVDESVQQLASATGLSESTVTACVRAFDALGLTKIVKRSARRHAPRRTFTMLDEGEHGGVRPHTDNARNTVGSDPTPSDSEHRGVDGATPWGGPPNTVGSDPTPPLTSTSTSPAVDLEHAIQRIANRAGQLHEEATPGVRIRGAIARTHTKRLLDTNRDHLARLATHTGNRSLDELARHANAGTTPRLPPPTATLPEPVDPLPTTRIEALLAAGRAQGRLERNGATTP